MKERSPVKWKILLLGILVLAGLAGFVFRQRLLVASGELLVSESTLGKADAIIVLAGGVPERIAEAVDLYKAGYAPRIVLTKAEEPENLELLRSYGIPALEDHEESLQIALKSKIPRGAITLLSPRINSTYAEIELLRDYCLKQEFRSVILVTSKSHTTRASKIFNHLAGGQIHVIARASRYDTFDARSWWKERRTAKEVLFEYEKLVHYYLIVVTGG